MLAQSQKIVDLMPKKHQIFNETVNKSKSSLNSSVVKDAVALSPLSKHAKFMDSSGGTQDISK